MARLALSKSSLAKERRKLSNFKRFLPSLDLKRRQLMAERANSRFYARLRAGNHAARTEKLASRLSSAASSSAKFQGLLGCTSWYAPLSCHSSSIRKANKTRRLIIVDIFVDKSQ